MLYKKDSTRVSKNLRNFLRTGLKTAKGCEIKSLNAHVLYYVLCISKQKGFHGYSEAKYTVYTLFFNKQLDFGPALKVA